MDEQIAPLKKNGDHCGDNYYKTYKYFFPHRINAEKKCWLQLLSFNDTDNDNDNDDDDDEDDQNDEQGDDDDDENTIKI